MKQKRQFVHIEEPAGPDTSCASPAVVRVIQEAIAARACGAEARGHHHDHSHEHWSDAPRHDHYGDTPRQ